jgi:DNA-binding CsgD family transcriptional regulator
MLDRPERSRKKSNSPNNTESASNNLARFSVEERQFRLVLVEKPCELDRSVKDINEITRFKMLGLTLAIVEDRTVDELDREARNMIARLTGRELQIAAMTAQGNATKNVAHKLRISEWTVGSHLRRIFAKLGVDNRAAMVYRCAALIESAPQPEERKPRERASAAN